MKNQREIPMSIDQNLSSKQKQLKDSIDLMLDWRQSNRIKESLLPKLNNLTVEEIDYCLKLVRYLDNRVQLRGPLASIASEALIENEAELKKMEGTIGPERAKTLKDLIE